MTDRPIIFSAAMIRALLREVEAPGTGKTMTRRLASSPLEKCQPGDRLYVRESFTIRRWDEDCYFWFEYGDGSLSRPIQMEEEYLERVCARVERAGWKIDGENYVPPSDNDRTLSYPAIHMPRAASRITLTITAAKREKLQAISEEDAIAEGIASSPGGMWSGAEGQAATSPKGAFALLWQSLHGDDAWASNPEIIALSFTCALRNIDAKEAA